VISAPLVLGEMFESRAWRCPSESFVTARLPGIIRRNILSLLCPSRI
jgi:hypothetical protein